MDSNIYIACLRQVVAFAPKVINAPPTASHTGGVEGFININDMYNNDVGKGGAQGCEAYEVK